MFRTRGWISAAVMIAIAGSSLEAQRAAPPVWALGARPVLLVGDNAEVDSSLFGSIADARLMPNGVLAVADGGEFAVLLFDAAGKRIAKLGRRGRGPGEFNGRISLAQYGEDAVAVWDPTQTRWTVVKHGSSELTVLREGGGDAAWMHAGVLVLGEGHVPDWAPPLIRVLVDSMPMLRRAFLDETSLLWVHRDRAMREWIAYAGARAVGQVTLPSGFRPMQFRGNRVVGVQTDTDDFEQVAIYQFARPSGVNPSRGALAVSPADSGQRNQLRAAMRNAVVAQEIFYASHNTYTARSDSLTLQVPEGARFSIVDATNRHWSGSMWMNTTGYTCGMIIGAVPPRGWAEGAPRCGW
jgi:hypothetical protein